jgi:hypothetical protein
MTTLKLGCIAKDKITGFQGVVTAHSRMLTNVDRWTLQPQAVKDGKPIASKSFDEGQLVFVEDTTIRVTPVERPDEPVEMGDTVRLLISGLEGVVTAITTWSEGCVILQVQPRELHEGLPVDALGADERSVDIIQRAKPKPEAAPARVKTGGPRPEPLRAR